MEYSCEYCEVTFKRKGDLTRHTLSVKCKEKRDKFNINTELNNNIFKLEKELEQYKLKEFEYIKFIHIYRVNNKRADELSNLAINKDNLDEKMYYDKDDEDEPDEIL